MDPPPPYNVPTSKGAHTIEHENEQVELTYRAVNLSEEDQKILCKIVESVVLNQPALENLSCIAGTIKRLAEERLILEQSAKWKCVISKNKIYANGFSEDSISKSFLADVCGLNILLFNH